MGTHVRLNSTSEVVELIGLDDNEAQIKSTQGTLTVGRNEISRLTAEEELARLNEAQN